MKSGGRLIGELRRGSVECPTTDDSLRLTTVPPKMECDVKSTVRPERSNSIVRLGRGDFRFFRGRMRGYADRAVDRRLK